MEKLPFRVGVGYDIHRTAEGDGIWLGGMRVAVPFSLVGQSDADVLLHAATDAILGALGDCDIGHYFPPQAEENRNRSSADFVRFAVAQMEKAGYTLANLDCNIICEEPRIAPLREKLRQSLATLLRVSPARISIKGRSHEGLDAIGERRAIACQVVVLLMAAAGNPS